LSYSIVAEVRKGNKPIIGSQVTATVERPPNSHGDSYPPVVLQLYDNGVGADFVKNDGIYARYFNQFTGKGRYNVKCEVNGDRETVFSNGFKYNKNDRSLPMKSGGSPLCCGSDAVNPDSDLIPTGAFVRYYLAGSFNVPIEVTSRDVTPPIRTTDLHVSITDSAHNNNSVRIEFTSPGDDLDSSHPAAEYVIKYSTNREDLKRNFDTFETRLVAEDLLYESDMSPVSGCYPVVLYVKPEIFQRSSQYFFALKSVDEAGNVSPISNIRSFYTASSSTTCNFFAIFLLMSTFSTFYL